MNRLGTALIVGSLGLASTAFADTLRNGKSYYGEPVVPSTHTRVIDLAQASPINVKCGEAVTFVNGSKQFTWKFDSISHRGVALSALAPTSFGAAGQGVYIGRNASEIGG